MFLKCGIFHFISTSVVPAYSEGPGFKSRLGLGCIVWGLRGCIFNSLFSNRRSVVCSV